MNWYSLGKSDDGSKELSIDLDSIRRHDNGSFQYLSVWTKWDLITAQKPSDGNLDRQLRGLHYYFIDCNNQKWQLAEAIGYDSQGGLIESYDFQNPGLVSTYSSTNWGNTIPETVGDVIAATACYYINNQ